MASRVVPSLFSLPLVVLLAVAARGERPLTAQAYPLPPGAVARMGSLAMLHGDDVRCVAFFPDGQTLVTAGDGSEARVWDRRTGKEVRRFTGHDSTVLCLALSADGKILVSGDNSDKVIVWDATNGKVIHQLRGHPSSVYAVALSGDAKLLASGGLGQIIRVWDVATGKPLLTLPGHGKFIRELAFSPDAKVLASGGDDGAVHLWDTTTGQQLRVLKGHKTWISGLLFTLDGGTLISAADERELKFWDHATGKLLSSLEVGDTYHLALSPDGKTLAVANSDHSVSLWDLATRRRSHRLGGFAHVRVAAFSPDGKVLASAGRDQRVHLWDVGSGKEIQPPTGHQGVVRAVACAPDGNTVASAGDDGTIRLWDLASGRELRRWQAHERAGFLAYLPDGKRLVSAAQGNANFGLRVWEAETGQELARFGVWKNPVMALALSPDGKTLATGGMKTFYLWGLPSGKEVRELTGHEEWFEGLAFSPDNKTVATVLRYGTVQLWDAAEGKLLRTLKGSAFRTSTVAFLPDGRTFLAGADHVDIQMFETATGRPQRVVAKGSNYAGPFVLSRDGRRLAVATYRTLQVWEVGTGRQVLSLKGHEGQIHALAFTPDGRTLITGGADAALLAWDMTGLRDPQVGRPGPLTKGQLEWLWEALAGADAGAAHRAVWRLAADPRQAVPVLGERLRVVAAQEARIPGWIADLGSPKFKARQEASSELEKLGDLATDALRRALADEPPLETRRRIEMLLQKLPKEPVRSERWRSLRAVEALQHSGTVEARNALEALADGPPLGMVATEARASLRFLRR